MSAETLTLSLFLAGLAVCLAGGFPLLYALLFGLLCFSLYSRLRCGFSFPKIAGLLLEGAAKIANILVIFVLIGSLTALWRSSGTIPFILYHSIGLINPRFIVLCTFLLCCAMSYLTGTSFGTVSTIGVICMLISDAAGLSPLLTGGAILSGIYFGDRCSPMSSSAQLICSLTGTDIYRNIRGMMRTGLIPFLLSCLLYAVLAGSAGEVPDASFGALFADHFRLSWIVSLPALLILLLSLLHVDVKLAMGSSIAAAAVIALTLQDVSPHALLAAAWSGYRAQGDPQLARLLNGGGIRSMAEVGVIVLLSSSFSGIFSHTPLLAGLKRVLVRSARLLTPFGTVIAASLFSCGISCNQSLGSILTCQFCEDLYQKKDELALALENTAIVLCAVIPWSIAGAVPLATLGAPLSCMLFAFYLYLLPAWNLFTQGRRSL